MRTHGFEIIKDASGLVRFNAKVKKGGVSTWAPFSDIQTLLVVDEQTVHIKLKSDSGFVLDVDAQAFDQAYREWCHGGPLETTGGAA